MLVMTTCSGRRRDGSSAAAHTPRYGITRGSVVVHIQHWRYFLLELLHSNSSTVAPVGVKWCMIAFYAPTLYVQ
jgi:hypothetical protein